MVPEWTNETLFSDEYILFSGEERPFAIKWYNIGDNVVESEGRL